MALKHRRPARNTGMYDRFIEENLAQDRTDIQRLWKRAPQTPDPEIGIPYFFPLPPGASSLSSSSSSSSRSSSSNSSRSSVSSRSSGSSSSYRSSVSSSSSSKSSGSGFTACSFCPDSPATFNFTLAATNGGLCTDCATIDGTYTLSVFILNLNCTWQASLPRICFAGMQAILQYSNSTGNTTLDIGGNDNVGATYTASGCPTSGMVLSLSASVGCHWPATITLS